MKNLSGRKKSRRRHHSHHGHGVDNEQNDAQTSEDGERSHRSRRHRHHHKKRLRYNRDVGTSDDDQEDVNTGHKHHAIKIREDNSIAALVRASGSNQGISTAVSGTSSYVTNADDEVDDYGTFKEWIPHFIKHYGYSSLFRFASGADYILMGVGTGAAIVAGFCIPYMIYMLGNLIRGKVLTDKMSHCLNNTNASCESLWKKCDEQNSNHYRNKEFLERPMTQDKLDNITYECIRFFVNMQCYIALTYTISCSVYFFCWSYSSQNQGGKLRRAYFHSLLQKDLNWFNMQDDPDGINRTMENTRRIVEVLGESIPISISLTVMSIICIIMALKHGWQLAMICMGILPFFWITMWAFNVTKATKILKNRRAYRVSHDLAKDVFSKMRTVIGYRTQLAERALYKREIVRGESYVLKGLILHSLSVGLMYIVIFGLLSGVIWFGILRVIQDAEQTCTDKRLKNGKYDAGDFFIILLSTVFGCGNIYIILAFMRAAKVAKLCAREIFKVIDSPNGVDNMSKDGIFLDGPLIGKIEFIDVRFTYQSTKSGLVLHNLNFVAEPNQTVAIVGTSDSGKSTVLKLICKEYLADSGFVQIDGRDIRSYNTAYLRSHIGFIPQELTLFDMSIEDNVRMGKLDANFFQIQEACIRAGAHDFIISFKEGYQTRVGHKGSRLTPGQKQLIAISRALIRDPKILLLDEPTYALDSQSVVEFMRSLQHISKGRTVILVAHRLATVVHASMIYVLKRGRVVEKGDHRTLINNDGPFSQLCQTNRSSNSFHGPTTKVEGFDSSEMTIISCAKTFNPKFIIPNIYNNMLNVDPVVSRVTYAILKCDLDTERGFHKELDWRLQEGEALTYTKAKEDDTFGKGLRDIKSRYNINDRSPSVADSQVTGKSAGMDEEDSDKDEFRAISILNSSKRSCFKVLMMGSTSSMLIFCGVLSTLFFSFGIPVFGLLLALIIDVFSSVDGYPESWKCQWVDRLKHKSYDFHIVIIVFIGGLGAYLGIFSTIADFCLSLAANRSVQKMRRVMYGCILNQDMSFFEDPKNSPVTLASILFQDTNSLRHITYGLYSTVFQCIFIIVTSITLCLLHSLDLAGYTFLVTLSVVAINLIDGWLAKKQFGKTIVVLSQISKLILQVFQSKHVITVCQMEPHFLNEFTTLQRKSLGTSKSLSCLRTFTFGLAQSSVFWGFIVFMYLGEERIKEYHETFLNVMINGFVLIFGLTTIGNNLSVLMGFKHIRKAGTRMLEIINRRPLISADDGLTVTEQDCGQEIEFVNAHFWKPLTPDAALLKGINLSIDPNQVTAIVGYPESGKSAYLELIGRYYDATGGLVTIAGKDVRYYSANSLREYISVVTKDPELFSRTVAQNIALGATFRRPSMDEVIKAAKEANVHSLIVSLPEGYETRVGGQHDYLSNTQKQKISIARALLKNPRIIIFEDVTHSLDKEGEKSVLESIETAKLHRTVIIISQRIQPVVDADWLVVMEKGYVEEQGRHDELLKQRAYGLMWRSQNPLLDENFLRGKTSYISVRYPEGSSSAKRLARLKDKTPLQASPTDQENPQDGEEQEKPEVTPRCGGIFGFMGLGIVEANDGDDNKGDRFNNF